MSEDFKVSAVKRDDLGKGASRRLRRAGNVPGVIYGLGDPVSITLKHSDLLKHTENEAFFSHVLDVKIDGKAELAIVADMQRHPSKPFITHIDFQRVKKGQEFTTFVPLRFINEEVAVGVKEQGGFLTHLLTEVQIVCIPSKLPEYIEVDVAKIEIGQILHLSDVKFPEGVRSTDLALGEDHDAAVITCLKARVVSEDDEAEAEVGDAEE